MKKTTTLPHFILSGLLALAAGCGKTENPPPSTAEADRTAIATKAAPEQSKENLATQNTNAVAAATNVAQSTLETGSKAANSAAAPLSASAPKVLEPPSPATNQNNFTGSPAKTTLASLSQDQMVQGLEEALAKGLQQAIANLGHDGGFLTNVSVKIPMPEKLQKVESALRAMKQDKLADDFVTTMNHAAEQAVPAAGSVFAEALKHLTIEDAKSILSGPNDAATKYFQTTTKTNLYARFYPIVQKTTAQTGVTAAYKNLMEKANLGQSLGSFGSLVGNSLLDKDSLDVDAYVTGKALDGLFKMVADEEQRIRQNPVARTTDILQKVFGALKK